MRCSVRYMVEVDVVEDLCWMLQSTCGRCCGDI